jgi:hypothetical protein
MASRRLAGYGDDQRHGLPCLVMIHSFHGARHHVAYRIQLKVG